MEKTDKVRAFFNNSSIYLSNRPSIWLRSEIIKKLVGDSKQKSILDIGCGDGSLSLPLVENNTVTFLDLSLSMLEEVKKKLPPECHLHIHILHGNFEDLSFSSEYDIILCIGVLAHVKDVENVILKISQLIRPSGKVLFQISDTRHLYYRFRSLFRSKSNTYGYSLNKISPEKLQSVAETYGLKIKKYVKYPVAVSMLRILGTKGSFRVLKAIYKIKMLRFLSSEHLIMFER